LEENEEIPRLQGRGGLTVGLSPPHEQNHIFGEVYEHSVRGPSVSSHLLAAEADSGGGRKG